MLQAFLPSMIENNHGHVVALSSLAGISGFPNLVPYCSSKFAVRGKFYFEIELNFNLTHFKIVFVSKQRTQGESQNNVNVNNV